MVVWLTVGTAVLLLIVVGAATVLRYADDVPSDSIDPLFATGIVLAGAGTALATTLGSFMYVLLAIGLIVMGVGAYRTRRRGHG